MNLTRSLPRVFEKVGCAKCHSNFLGGVYIHTYNYTSKAFKMYAKIEVLID